ncbi:hypothetical protein M427DRAFT_381999 [Gonapodya prolifera JEL478]|uniref:Potassium channel domain-containing protein n=1 Tax=Gonapodya prolifera (strain JEL478) TaxID=1344416 RepID=A0A139A8Y5_GONPJ|nr:hypothetical protein M427DRAFT_381999 [Gonapodya prolifera JEL478]|eukprot:KXS13272.1 hypothetical protein M427DRAFT_381999 [Gonapodya prolifera JEL478]
MGGRRGRHRDYRHLPLIAAILLTLALVFHCFSLSGTQWVVPASSNIENTFYLDVKNSDSTLGKLVLEGTACTAGNGSIGAAPKGSPMGRRADGTNGTDATAPAQFSPVANVSDDRILESANASLVNTTTIDQLLPSGIDKHWAVWLMQVLSLLGGCGGCYAMYQRMRGRDVVLWTKRTLYASVFQGSLLLLLLVIFTLTNPLPVTNTHQYSEGYYSSVQSSILSLVASVGLGLDWLWTEDFEDNGSGLSKAQGRLAVMVGFTVIYTSALSFFYHFMEGWPYPISLFFVLCTITTIGFGLPSPSTTLARMLTIPTATLGVILMGYTVSHTVEVIQEGVREGVRVRWKRRRTEGDYVRVSARTPEEEALSRAGGGWTRRVGLSVTFGWSRFTDWISGRQLPHDRGQYRAEVDADGDGEGVVVLDGSLTDGDYVQASGEQVPARLSFIKSMWSKFRGNPSVSVEMTAAPNSDGFESVGLSAAHQPRGSGTFASQATLVEIPSGIPKTPSNRSSYPPNLPLSFFALLCLLLSTAYVFSRYEEWSYFDALYFVWASFLTIGFGDLVPRTAGGLAFFNVVVGAAIGLVTWFGSLAALWWEGSWDEDDLGRRLAKRPRNSKKPDGVTKRSSKDEAHGWVAKWTQATLDGSLGDEDDAGSNASSDDDDDETGEGGVPSSGDKTGAMKSALKLAQEEIEDLLTLLDEGATTPSLSNALVLAEEARRFIRKARDIVDGKVLEVQPSSYVLPAAPAEDFRQPNLEPLPPPPSPRTVKNLEMANNVVEKPS